MKIEVFAICYNEEFMLPFFLEHYANIPEVTKITIFDNFSTDRSVEICNKFYKKKVEVLPYDTNGEIRDDVYLKIKNDCWKGASADWVIVCDIDELVTIDAVGILLLNSVERMGYKAVKCLGYEMVSEKLPKHDDDPITRQLRNGFADSRHDKILLFSSSLTSINYDFGCHHAYPMFNNDNAKVFVSNSNFKMLHYKFLSLDYVKKVYKERAARLSEFNKEKSLGFHYISTEEQLERLFNYYLTKQYPVL